MDKDLNLLECDISSLAASVPTTNGGGLHGHVGMICNDATYITILNGRAAFIVPTNLGTHPTTVSHTKHPKKCLITFLAMMQTWMTMMSLNSSQG